MQNGIENPPSGQTDKPSDKMKGLLAKLGVPANDVAQMTWQQAHDRIDAELTKKNGGKPPASYVQSPQDTKPLLSLEEAIDAADKIRGHIMSSGEYSMMTEMGQVAVFREIYNNYVKSLITDKISRQRGRR